ncbi:MAG TPA: hypothetical protein VFC90_12025 [Planctomycetota bacterium]|nr:hypothetical protein [Planctomycetota bacterium]
MGLSWRPRRSRPRRPIRHPHRLGGLAPARHPKFRRRLIRRALRRVEGPIRPRIRRHRAVRVARRTGHRRLRILRRAIRPQALRRRLLQIRRRKVEVTGRRVILRTRNHP